MLYRLNINIFQIITLNQQLFLVVSHITYLFLFYEHENGKKFVNSCII